MQLLAFNLGGGLEQSETREYGPADLRFVRSCALWDGIDLTKLSRVWMSHGDTVKTPPAGFLVTGSTDTLEVAAMADEARKIYAVQFHPEVHHSVDGDTMLRNFLFKIAKITPDWTMSSFVERVINEVRETVGDGHVVCALSGGVDSSVVAALLIRAIGKQLTCVHVNHGLLRKGEPEQVVEVFRHQMDANLIYVDAVDRFLINWPAQLILSRNARSSARSSSECLRRRPVSWRHRIPGPGHHLPPTLSSPAPRPSRRSRATTT